jgi:two-component system sensor histidine kinase UhpB
MLHIILGVLMMLIAALLAERRFNIVLLQRRNHAVSRLASRLITAQEAERRRMSRELHDEVGQLLTTVKINLDILRMGEQSTNQKELLDEGSRLVDEVLKQVRDLSALLRPALLDNLGLEPALRSLLHTQAKRIGYQAAFHAKGVETRLPRDVEMLCYRIAQEALTNVARHAQAKRVLLSITVNHGTLNMTLQDDGIGFDVKAKVTGAATGMSTGLLNMIERAQIGGGELRMTSSPSLGTTLCLDLPIHALLGQTRPQSS